MHSKKMMMKQELNDLFSFLIQLLWCTCNKYIQLFYGDLVACLLFSVHFHAQ